MFGRVLQNLVCLGLIVLVSAQDADDVVRSVAAHRDEKAPSGGEVNSRKSVPSSSQPAPEDDTSMSHGTEEIATTGEDIASSPENSTVPGSEISEPPVASGLTNSKLGLECYTCLNCTVSHGVASARKCAASNDLRRPNLCVSYTIKYRGTDLQLRARGCTQEMGTCRVIEKSLTAQRIIQIENCVECSGNLCNSSHALHAIIFNLIGLVFTATIANTVVV